MDDLFQFLLAGFGQFRRAGPAPEQFRRHGVHARVRALRGQHRCHEQLPGVAVVKMGSRLGVTGGECLKDAGGLCATFLECHSSTMPQEAPPRKAPLPPCFLHRQKWRRDKGQRRDVCLSTAHAMSLNGDGRQSVAAARRRTPSRKMTRYDVDDYNCQQYFAEVLRLAASYETPELPLVLSH